MRKWLALVLLTTLLLLAGCGSKPAAEPAAKAPETPKAPEPVTLRVVFSGTSEPEKAWSVKVKEQIEKKYQHIKIEYMYIPWGDLEKKLTIMIQANDYPDIIQTQELANLIAMKAMEPLDSYLTKADSPTKKDHFIQGALEYSAYDGKTYALPLAAIGYGLMVNEELLSKAGLKPEDLKTWDDVLKAAPLLTKGETYAMGYASGAPRFSWRDPAMHAWSNGLFTPADVDDAHKKAYLEVLTHYNNMRPYMPPAVTAWTYPDMSKAFANGQIAMMPFGSYFTANVYGFNPDIIAKTKVIPIPKGPSAQKQAVWAANVGFGMLAGGKNKDAAWLVLQELVSKDAVGAFAASTNMPSRMDVTTDAVAKDAQAIYPKAADAHAKLITSFVPMLQEYGKTQPRIVGQAEMEVAFQSHMVQMLQGKLTPEQAYENIRRDISQLKK
ncbi:MAG TPA: sugar ABC transporter substrate-binding protein [Symbiobacteriaceae bacterium]|nr:sugar ABC transporter substrate-binding protein [Symbiobacteriaceae bacterium]